MQSIKQNMTLEMYSQGRNTSEFILNLLEIDESMRVRPLVMEFTLSLLEIWESMAFVY